MAATHTAATPSTTPGTAARIAVHALVRLSAERLLSAREVAAAKWGTDRPVEDPVRERQILAAARARAACRGLSPALARRFAQDQMDAAKLVQHALHARWRAHPAERPRHRPDLTLLRPHLDSLDARLLHALATALPHLTAPLGGAELARQHARVSTTLALDPTHRTALTRALTHAHAHAHPHALVPLPSPPSSPSPSPSPSPSC
ncbi:gamma subclass chorismate mutase AroQ [Streptomyces sp. NPDC097619]|uniref:gamma subclass chorismate mutase AroQ n=1 Tax=Streptomyces sp. NPDC097619 TaxID=3157228 RepID=UPI003333A023